MITFNKPHLTGKETAYITEAVALGKISGNGDFTKKCQRFFENKFSFKKALLTTSCTDALEMAALLLDIKPGDEVIMPSYTFVSTALAFVREGAKIVFVDSMPGHPNMDAAEIEPLITPRTKAIVVVYYAGVACDMAPIMALSKKHDIFVIEDAAQAIDSYYVWPSGEKQPLGSIGHLSAFSFHETKNIISGEGGLLGINDDRFTSRAEIIWEKGTNRAQFFRGEINKYGWVDTGSSFLPSEIVAAFLWAQLEVLDDIQAKRISIWNRYHAGLNELGLGNLELPTIPPYATNNAHMYYVVCQDAERRQQLIDGLRERGIKAVFHYLSLHKSPFYHEKHDGRELLNSDHYTECLVRLPMYFDLKDSQIDQIVEAVGESLS